MPAVVLEPGGDRIAHARQVLHSVPDPEVPAVSLYDLGIVRDVRLLENGVLDVVLTPTYSGCPATEVIESDVLAAISAAGLGRGPGHLAARTRLDDRLDQRRRPREIALPTALRPPGPGRCQPGRARALYAAPRCPGRAVPGTAPVRTPSACPPLEPPPARRCTVAWTAASRSSISSLFDKAIVMSVSFHPLRVCAIEPDTAEAVIVSFEVPPELRQVFRLHPRPVPHAAHHH